jgi:hypothetical protein
MKQYLLMVIIVCCLPGIGRAQTIYKCVSGGKTSYSSTPCASGTETKIDPGAGSSTAEQARATQRVQRELAQRDATESRRSEGPNQPVSTPSGSGTGSADIESRRQYEAWLREKKMIHTKDGWDYKTNAELLAGQEAKAARASRRAADEGKIKIDATGKPYISLGGMGIVPETGKPCPVVGNTIMCSP